MLPTVFSMSDTTLVFLTRHFGEHLDEDTCIMGIVYWCEQRRCKDHSSKHKLNQTGQLETDRDRTSSSA